MNEVLVAQAGTAAAALADFICDGVDDDVEINLAIAAAGGAGGGVVRIAAGDYWTSRPIAVLADRVALEGDAMGGTAIRPAQNWMSAAGAEGAGLTGIINFVGVDDFSARNLTVETRVRYDPDRTYDVVSNGIQIIPTGVDGAGRVSTDGVIENNLIRLVQAHDYSIWSVRSEGLVIRGNTVDGGSTPEGAHPAQEGIEIYGGHNVLIAGNTILGIGNAAINIGGLAAFTPDSSVSGITVEDNSIYYARVGVAVATTWSASNGSADASGLVIKDNSFDGIFETGFQLRNWTGDAASPPVMKDISFTGNDVTMLHAKNAGYSPAAVFFHNSTGIGETVQANLSIASNHFTSMMVDAAPPPLFLWPGFSQFFYLYGATGLSIDANLLDLHNTAATSSGIFAMNTGGLSVTRNDIRDAGMYPMQIYGSSDLLIDGNDLSDWGRGERYSGILVSQASGYAITSNRLTDPSGGLAVHLVNIHESVDERAVDGNVWLSERDASLVGSRAQHLTLLGEAIQATGNDGDNILTGNDRDNILAGGAGRDVMRGGMGDDHYDVDDVGDQVEEAAGQGRDTVETSVSFTLAKAAEIERLVAKERAATNATILIGNPFDQTIEGNDGANVLHGGGGNDVLIGFDGDDTYYTDVAATRVVEAVGGGNDALYTSISYVLGQGVAVETLSTNLHIGVAAIDLTGNAFDQTIEGNNGANVLHGGGGNDVLIGFDGDDTYYTDVAATRVVEAVGGGNDALYTSVSYVLRQGVAVETLSTNLHIGVAAIDLIGNAFDQLIQGNNGANMLNGAGGSDVLTGYGGSDTFAFSTPLDGKASRIADFAPGTDQIALSAGIFAGLAPGVLPLGAFAGTDGQPDSTPTIAYDRATGNLFFDRDGAGADLPTPFATVTPGLVLTASDFLII